MKIFVKKYSAIYIAPVKKYNYMKKISTLLIIAGTFVTTVSMAQADLINKAKTEIKTDADKAKTEVKTEAPVIVDKAKTGDKEGVKTEVKTEANKLKSKDSNLLQLQPQQQLKLQKKLLLLKNHLPLHH